MCGRICMDGRIDVCMHAYMCIQESRDTKHMYVHICISVYISAEG